VIPFLAAPTFCSAATRANRPLLRPSYLLT
jgi:hypothetical protein